AIAGSALGGFAASVQGPSSAGAETQPSYRCRYQVRVPVGRTISARVLRTRSALWPATARRAGLPSMGISTAGLVLTMIFGTVFFTATPLGSCDWDAASELWMRSSATTFALSGT